MRTLRDDRLVAALLAGLAVAVHLPDLAAGFLADDFGHLNSLCEGGRPSLRRALGYFVQPLPGIDPPLPPEHDPRFWRPMFMLSLGIDLRLFGVRAWAFQGVDVLLHAGVVAALFAALKGRDRGVAIAAASLFAVWPGAHEAVPWISARSGPMALLGTLGALWGVERRSGWAAPAAAFALLSKETAFVVAPLVTVFALCGRGDRRAALRATLPVWATFGVYLGARYWMLGELGGGYAMHDTPVWAASLWPGRLETARTLLGPIRSIHVGEGARGAMAVAVAAWVVAGTITTARQRPDLRWLLLAGWLWLGGALVPIHDLAVLWQLQIDARFLYEPGAPLCLLIALGGAWIRRPLPLLVAALIALAGLYVANTTDRREATHIATAVVEGAADAIHRVPGDRYVFVDLPSHHRGVQLANNALPWALAPPFTDAPVRQPIEVLYDNRRDPGRLQTIGNDMRRGEAVRVWVWDGGTRTFRRMWPR